jgi:hypothetical protein
VPASAATGSRRCCGDQPRKTTLAWPAPTTASFCASIRPHCSWSALQENRARTGVFIHRPGISERTLHVAKIRETPREPPDDVRAGHIVSTLHRQKWIHPRDEIPFPGAGAWLAAQMPFDQRIGHREERLVRALPALDPRLGAYQGLPFMRAGGRIAGAVGRGTLPSHRVHIDAPGEETPEQRDLRTCRGVVGDRRSGDRQADLSTCRGRRRPLQQCEVRPRLRFVVERLATSESRPEKCGTRAARRTHGDARRPARRRGAFLLVRPVGRSLQGKVAARLFFGRALYMRPRGRSGLQGPAHTADLDRTSFMTWSNFGNSLAGGDGPSPEKNTPNIEAPCASKNSTPRTTASSLPGSTTA